MVVEIYACMCVCTRLKALKEEWKIAMKAWFDNGKWKYAKEAIFVFKEKNRSLIAEANE